MFCIINYTIGTILFTTDKNRTVSLLIVFFFSVTLAINRYLGLKNNPINKFQFTPTTVDIGLNKIPLIALLKGNKELLDIIKDHVHFTCKVKGIQTRYLVPNHAKCCWNKNNFRKRFCIIIILVLATDVVQLGTIIKLFSRNIRVKKIVSSNLVIQCKNCIKYGYYTDIYKTKKLKYSICSKQHTTRKHYCLDKDYERLKKFKWDCCKMQKATYECYHSILHHTTTLMNCIVRKTKNFELREANKTRCQYKLKEANISI